MHRFAGKTGPAKTWDNNLLINGVRESLRSVKIPSSLANLTLKRTFNFIRDLSVMARKKLQKIIMSAALMLAGAIPVFGMTQDISSGITKEPVLIISADVPVSCLSRSMARNIWSFRIRSWPDYTAIKVVSFNAESEGFQKFAESGLNYRPYQLSRTWDKATSLGFGSPFKTVNSASQMIDLVEQNNGAIGFLFPEDVAKLRYRRIKTLNIMDDLNTQKCMAEWIRIQNQGKDTSSQGAMQDAPN